MLIKFVLSYLVQIFLNTYQCSKDPCIAYVPAYVHGNCVNYLLLAFCQKLFHMAYDESKNFVNGR